MDRPLKKIIVGLIMLTLALLLIGILLFKTVFTAYYFWFFPVLMFIFLIVNSGFFVFFHRSLKKPHNQFIRNFMASTGVKIMIYFILALVYILTSPKTALPFALTLFTAYIVYTAYDLFVMLSLLKRRKENSQ